jgi:hypothetical protein
MTYIVSRSPSMRVSDRDLKAVSHHLLTSSPSKTAYSPLISRAFASPVKDNMPVDAINRIQSSSRTLRLHELSCLKIAFVNQATTYFDETYRETMGHEPECGEITRVLAKVVAEAGTAETSSDDLDFFAPPIVHLQRKRELEGFKTLVQKRRRCVGDRGGVRPRKWKIPELDEESDGDGGMQRCRYLHHRRCLQMMS